MEYLEGHPFHMLRREVFPSPILTFAEPSQPKFPFHHVDDLDFACRLRRHSLS
jgi:hypothetical protein